MRNVKAKQLRRKAEEKTVGQSVKVTTRIYRRMKKNYVRGKL